MAYHVTHEVKRWQRINLLRDIVRAAFPDYRKTRVVLKADPDGATTVTLHGLNWDGGSRSEYRKVWLGTGLSSVAGVAQLGDHMAHPMNNTTEGTMHTVGEHEAIVEAGTFCGKQAIAYVYLSISALRALQDIEKCIGGYAQ